MRILLQMSAAANIPVTVLDPLHPSNDDNHEEAASLDKILIVSSPDPKVTVIYADHDCKATGERFCPSFIHIVMCTIICSILPHIFNLPCWL